MGKLGSRTSREVRELVHTVEQLATEDQERILRIVRLLTLVPAPAQLETQRRLRDLVDRNPRSMLDCLSGVDEVIDYLETCILAAHEPLAPGRCLCTAVSRRRN